MSIQPTRGSLGSAPMRGRDSSASAVEPGPSMGAAVVSPELFRSLAEVKGQAQFLLYLADQIDTIRDTDNPWILPVVPAGHVEHITKSFTIAMEGSTRVS